ncbi:MAG: RdgB/HAM1 family non-canonical purine NTP pyrophosphatase [Planctomycetota bacterium]
MFRLVLGTHNPKKLKELQGLLEPYPVQLDNLANVPDPIEVEETGQTFQENAELKAVEQAKHLRQWVLAEDSGICVDALDGAPGIYSARFSGDSATDERNNQLLLEKLKDVGWSKRGAFYTSHIALADPLGNVHVNCEARCYGRILKQPRGDNGFGYDPLFELPEYHQTFGELGPAVKSLLSHRARANRQLVPKLLSLIAKETSELSWKSKGF